MNKAITFPTGNYFIDMLVGQGKYGSVYRVYMINDEGERQYYAVKVIDQRIESSKDEIDILGQIGHPGLAQMSDYLRDESGHYILMPYYDGTSLIYHCQTLTLLQIVDLMYQMLQAVDYLHQNGIVHRDIKSSNYIVYKNQPILIDFGMACSDRINPDQLRRFCGTPEYLAPEVIKGKGHAFSIPMLKAADVWALGVTFYYMIYGDRPFKYSGSAKDRKPKLYQNITDPEYRRKIRFDLDGPAKLTKEIVSLIKEMLSFNWKHRPTVHSILAHWNNINDAIATL